MAATKEVIEKFFSSAAYAVVGVSADQRKFGNKVFRTMREREFEVYPVNPKLQAVEGVKCFSSIMGVPDSVKSIVTVVPPQATEEVLGLCAKKGIQVVWMQPGSEPKDAIRMGMRYNLALIHRECILMFLEPVQSVHALHRWLNKLVGAYPR